MIVCVISGDIRGLTPASSGEPHVCPAAPSHCLDVSGSTSHRASVDGQFPPRLVTVFRRVMYVPPITGSLTLAWKAMQATYMLYSAT